MAHYIPKDALVADIERRIKRIILLAFIAFMMVAEFLPLESADMYYYKNIFFGAISAFNGAIMVKKDIELDETKMIPALSIGALLSVLPKVINNETLFVETSPALWHIGYRDIYTERADNLVNACYEMILKLNELKLL